MSFVPVPESRAEWLAMRRGYVGASEVSALFDAQPAYALSRFALWHVKAGRIDEPEVEEERSRWGILLEPVIAAETALQEGWHIEPGRFAIDDTTPGMSATLDYEIASHADDAKGYLGRGILECKAVDWLIFKRQWGEAPPLHIELQLQHQISCAGYQWGAIAALVSGNELHVWRRKARPRIIDGIRARVRAFWASIAAGQVPNTDGTDSTADALRALYAVPEDREADIPAELVPVLSEACGVFLAEVENRKAGAKRETAVKNLIKAALGDAARAFIPSPDGQSPAYSISRTKSNVINVKEISPT